MGDKKGIYIAFSLVQSTRICVSIASVPIRPHSASRLHVYIYNSRSGTRVRGKVAASFCSLSCAISRCPEHHSLQTAFIGFIGSVSSPVCLAGANPKKNVADTTDRFSLRYVTCGRASFLLVGFFSYFLFIALRNSFLECPLAYPSPK